MVPVENKRSHGGSQSSSEARPKPADPSLRARSRSLGCGPGWSACWWSAIGRPPGSTRMRCTIFEWRLRRCRSLADGLMAIDPDSSWKEMKKAGRKLFQALGELRDMQVMAEWIEKLGDATVGDAASRVSTGDEGDPVAAKLLDHVHAREAECKQHAFKDLDQFDRKQWRQWASSLPRRAARVRPGSVVYLHLALGKVDRRLRSAQTRFADSVAGGLARTAHRHQTLPLHGGKFSAAAARVVGRRSERTAGSAGRGARSGCAVGHGGRDHGVSRYGEPRAAGARS